MESANLIIRESTFSDCTLFAEWEKKKYITDAFTMSSPRDYEEIAKEYAIRTQQKDKLQFTIVHRGEDRPIGRVYISRIDRYYDSLDITRIYIGEEEFLGKGYGEEALRLLLEYCFINMHMERITVEYLLDCKQAEALCDKIGFRKEGILRNAGKKEGRYVNLCSTSMLRAEYFEKCSRRVMF